MDKKVAVAKALLEVGIGKLRDKFWQLMLEVKKYTKIINFMQIKGRKWS